MLSCVCNYVYERVPVDRLGAPGGGLRGEAAASGQLGPAAGRKSGEARRGEGPSGSGRQFLPSSSAVVVLIICHCYHLPLLWLISLCYCYYTCNIIMLLWFSLLFNIPSSSAEGPECTHWVPARVWWLTRHGYVTHGVPPRTPVEVLTTRVIYVSASFAA